MNPLSISLRSPVRPVVLEMPDGTIEEFELREMTASVRERYLDQLRDRISFGPDGKVTAITKYDGMHAALLVSCLFRKSKNAPVTKEEVQKWPANVVSTLFIAAQEINGIGGNQEKEDSEKKD